MDWMMYGPRGLLLRFAEKAGEAAFLRGRAILAELECRPPPGLIEVIPGLTTVALEFDPVITPRPSAVIRELLPRLDEVSSVEPSVRAAPKCIPVLYNGEDLGRVASLAGLSIPEVVALHSAPVYRVYLLGFSPGFPYLGELHPKLRTPRLPSPRPKVKAGSVAIGGEHTGIYSVASPGGWNLIGHTAIKIFNSEDPSKGEEMFYFRPGDTVRFVPVETNG